MAYFDAHAHPSFKSFMSDDISSKREDCWHVYNNLVTMLDSQSSLSQAEKGFLRLGVAAIITLEPPYAASVLTQIAKNLTYMDDDMLDRPTGSEDWTYFWEEIKHLEKSIAKSPQKVQIIKSFEDFDDQKMNYVLAIEGAHCLGSNIHNAQENLIALKKMPGYRFLYLTLVHQTRYPTSNHAFSVKMLSENKQFWPKGSGLTPYGRQIIETAYDSTIGGYSLLIDVKHLSISARREYYALHKAAKYAKIPILASHVGLTGISWEPQVVNNHVLKTQVVGSGETLRVFWKKPQGIANTEFNPWSVNLYDEEIVEIVESDGLIGLILDRRVLGAEKVSEEYFDRQNYSQLGYNERERDADGNEVTILTDPIEGLEQVFAEKAEEIMQRVDAKDHLRHFCNQIFHLIARAGAAGWKHISIGSDFDGMVSPIKSCMSVAEFPALELNLRAELLAMLPAAQRKYPAVNFALDANNVEVRVRDIMYNNGANFVEKYFAKDLTAPVA